MSRSLFLTLICCAAAAGQPHAMRGYREATVGQLDALHIAVEAAPTELHVGDVVFVRISVTNNGKEPVFLPGWLSRFLANLRLHINDRQRESRFTLQPYGHGMGGADPREVKPGERWFLHGYSRVHVPPIESTGNPFWSPQGLSENGYDLSVSLILTPRVHVVAFGPTLKIRPRPQAELAKLLELCGMHGARRTDIPPDWDHSPPNLNWFAFPLAPARASTAENLATLEAVLSPGTLRDLVRLTRRAQAVYDAQGVEQKRMKLDELLSWLERLPEVQRQCMTSGLLSWTRNNKGLGLFGYEIAVEAALRPSLWEGDLNTRRAWLKRRLEGRLAAPYLKDFEERLKAVEKTLQQRGKRPEKQPSSQDDNEFKLEDDPLSPFRP